MGNITWGASPIEGTGVFATGAIAAGDTIEVCPVLVVPADQVALLDRTSLYDYYFAWAGGGAALALGLGSLYNHAEDANAAWEKDFDRGTVTYRALRAIAVGEEIVVCYGDSADLWFAPRVSAGLGNEQAPDHQEHT